jgi:hypothetical protein
LLIVSAAVSLKKKQNLMQTRCSFNFAIEKSAKTMTEAQDKNHTDPTDLSSRTPLGQLMLRAVEYAHQTRADKTNAPLPSRKKVLFIFGSPLALPIFLPKFLFNVN